PDVTQIGDDDNTDSSTPVTDGGTTDADAAPPAPVPAKLLLVHASPDAPAVRICVGYDNLSTGVSAIQPIVPTPNNAQGVPPGFGGPAPSPPSGTLQSQNISFYAIPSATLAAAGVLPNDAGSTTGEKTCKDLLGSTIVAGSDAGTPDGGVTPIKIGSVPANTFMDGNSYIV